jgi:hypothetical protein
VTRTPIERAIGRTCTGETNPERTHAGVKWCGKQATLVSTAPDGMQWFSCDDPKHQAETTVPIAEWFAHHGLPVP